MKVLLHKTVNVKNILHSTLVLSKDYRNSLVLFLPAKSEEDKVGDAGQEINMIYGVISKLPITYS